jgi:hypothetical protein
MGCRRRRPKRSAVVGHEGQFLSPKLNARCQLGERTFAGTCGNGRDAPILLKNSLSAMFDFLGGLWARHSKNQLGDQPICRLGSVRDPQPVCDGVERQCSIGLQFGEFSSRSIFRLFQRNRPK